MKIQTLKNNSKFIYVLYYRDFFNKFELKTNTHIILEKRLSNYNDMDNILSEQEHLKISGNAKHHKESFWEKGSAINPVTF